MIRRVFLLLTAFAGVACGQTASLKALETLDAPGGLIVCVGADDVARAAALNRDSSFLVHLLYTEEGAAQKASSVIAGQDLGGRVSVSVFDGVNLPFIDRVVNLLIVENGSEVSREEALRVLTPRGDALFRQNGKWRKTTKPVPPTIDEWTHNLYDSCNSAVSRDIEAGPPRHLQWAGNPRYCRTHDGENSFQAMVSAGGRVFYIMDEGSKAFLSLPPKWILTARDACNGKVLWKKALDQPFSSHLLNLKSGIASLAHRIVAQKDVVYVTLGFNAPVTALDSRTGRELWTSEESANAEELLLYDGILYCTISLSGDGKLDHPYKSLRAWRSSTLAVNVPRKIAAFEATSGSKLWEHVPAKTVLPLSLTAGKYGVFFHDADSIVCLNGQDGATVWRSEPVDYWREMRLYGGVNLVLHNKTLLFASGRDYRNREKGIDEQNKITALDAGSGKILWTAPHPQNGTYFTASDLMIADGLVWTAAIDHPRDPGKYIGYDPQTGKVVREFDPDPGTHMPHHRCHRNRGTDRFLFTGRTGVDAFNVRSGEWSHDYWLRGTCKYGMMPANGMLYVPPNSCSCYVNAKLKSFNALTAASDDRRVPVNPPDIGRRVKGIAYAGRAPRDTQSADWPAYRGSASRHGVAGTRMSERYETGWSTLLKGRLTQPVIADGKVIVSAIDQHTVYALGEDDGRVAWRFQAGGIVNSPPTLWRGRAFFGCNDGWVYCLNIRTGALVWKYRAAPLDRRLIAYENVESVWPVHGSVLVLPKPKSSGGRVYCIAGRSMFLDGGLRSIVLDAASGERIAETVMDDKDPDTGESIQKGREWRPNFPAALPDVLSYDGRNIYMGTQPFDLAGRRKGIYEPNRAPFTIDGPNGKPMQRKRDTRLDHLFATVGFLDDYEWHRSMWQYGSDSFGGCWEWHVPANVSPAGNILCVDDTSVFGFGREYYVEGKKPTMHLFRTARNPELKRVEKAKDQKIELRGPAISNNTATRPVYDWSTKLDVYVRALLVAGNADPKRPGLLFAVGVPEIIDEYDAHTLIERGQAKGAALKKIHDKERAAAGELGATLLIVSTADGTVISETELAHPAVFDGISAANGRIFISDTEGRVLCLKPTSQPKGQPMKTRALSASVAGITALAAVTGHSQPDWVRFSDDGSRVVVEAEGISSFEGVSSAVYNLDGQNRRVGTKGYAVVEPVRESVGTTPFGDAALTKATFAAKDSPFQYTLTLKRLKNLRAFTAQAVFHNRSDRDVRLSGFDLLDMNKGPGGSFAVADPGKWLVTPLMEDSPALPLSEMNRRVKEAALVYHARGNGFLVGPVGPAEAYTHVTVRAQSLAAGVQMDGVLVRAGESRRSEEMIFLFEPVPAATDVWTRWVAVTHGARMHRGPVYGWCSWYDRTTKIDETHALEVIQTIEANPDTFGRGIIQIDFNGIGSRFLDPTKTRMQVFRELYTLYREAAGEEMYILSCLGSPTRGVIGFIDSARVGPDSHPAHFEKCLKSVLRFHIYDNVWWQNDADVSYLAPKLESRRVGYTPQGEGMWRTWHAIVGLVGGTAMISEPVNMPDAQAVLRNYEIMRPGSREPARLLTLGSSPDNTVFGFTAKRPYGDFAVYNLYNCTEGTKPLTLDFEDAGLPQGAKCAVFDFWENRVVGYATDSYTTAPLEYHSSALLRFTPLTDDGPTLVGSDLHLSIGATEIDDLRVSPSKVELVLGDAGAQKGAFTFFSKRPLAAAGSENCKVASVQNLGDDFWRVNITGRQWSKEQSVTLRFPASSPPVEKSEPPAAEPSAHFLHLDRNEDGRITREEYVGMFADSFPHQDKNKDGVLSAAEFNHPAFKTMDTDKDGKATLDEFKTMYSDQFGGIDRNRDGVITAEEM